MDGGIYHCGRKFGPLSVFRFLDPCITVLILILCLHLDVLCFARALASTILPSARGMSYDVQLSFCDEE